MARRLEEDGVVTGRMDNLTLEALLPPIPSADDQREENREAGAGREKEGRNRDDKPPLGSALAPPSRIMGRPLSESRRTATPSTRGSQRRNSASRMSSRSSLAGSDDPKRLLDAKLMRKKADEDVQLMKNRVYRLRIETERARKNMEETHKRAEEIVKLKAQNELRARAKEHARVLREQQLQREQQQKALARAQHNASVRASTEMLRQQKQRAVQDCRRQRQNHAQEAWAARREEEERAARLKQEVYTRERQALHERYRHKHLKQLRAVQTYEQRVSEEELARVERESMVQQLEREEAALLESLREAQSMQRDAYAELEVALEV